MARAKKNSAEEAFKAAREARSNLSDGWGESMNFLRFKEGKQTIRVHLDPDGLYAVPIFTNSGVSTEGKYFVAANLRFVYDTPKVLEAARAANKLTEEDDLLVAEYGDPCDRLRTALEQMGMDYKAISKERNNPLTRQQVLWMVGNDNQLAQLETTGAFLKWFESTADMVPDIINRDIHINGEGQGLARRYTYAYGPEATEQEPPGKPFSLIHSASRKVVPYREKVQMVFRSYPAFVAKAGLGYESFGVEA